MRAFYRNLLLAVLMAMTSVVAYALRPNTYLADRGPQVELEKMVPHTFEDWHLLKQPEHIVNPQQQYALDNFYTQILTRAYANTKGQTIMLSIAYGKDQSDEKQLHYPEVCYPAQGFSILSRVEGQLDTEYGSLPVKRLIAKTGLRVEPITYWTTVGDKVVLNGYTAKKAQLIYGFKGYIPDGLIFRVSSISNDSQAAFKLQQSFITELLKHVSADSRYKFAGITRSQ